MAFLVKELGRNYHYLTVDLADPRIPDWPLLGDPIPIIAIVVVYVWFVKVIGPNFMKHRKPFNLERQLIIYNIIQIICNGYVAIIATPFFTTLNVRCSEINYSVRSVELAYGYYYYLLKILDLADTVFIVLRKKNEQITFLHVYHHASMLFCGWLFNHYFAGGHSSFLVYINLWVHTIMYTYYLITTFNKEAKYSLRWKRHITHVQLIQFTLILFIYLQPLIHSDCKYSPIPTLLVLLQNAAMLILFGQFYYRVYVKKKTS